MPRLKTTAWSLCNQVSIFWAIAETTDDSSMWFAFQNLCQLLITYYLIGREWIEKFDRSLYYADLCYTRKIFWNVVPRPPRTIEVWF
jgi:hypothetical protein